MNKSLISATIALCLTGLGCAPTPVDETTIKSEIVSILKMQEAAWNRGSIRQFMDGYLQSDSLRFASGGSVTTGWKTTLDRYLLHYPDSASMGKLRFSDLRITVLAAAAFVFGKWRLLRAAGEPHGLFTLVFRKTAAGWRIIHDHTSAAPPSG